MYVYLWCNVVVCCLSVLQFSLSAALMQVHLPICLFLLTTRTFHLLNNLLILLLSILIVYRPILPYYTYMIVVSNVSISHPCTFCEEVYVAAVGLS